jgi:hypothetical protein
MGIELIGLGFRDNRTLMMGALDVKKIVPGSPGMGARDHPE